MPDPFISEHVFPHPHPASHNQRYVAGCGSPEAWARAPDSCSGCCSSLAAPLGRLGRMSLGKWGAALEQGPCLVRLWPAWPQAEKC